MVQPIIRIAWCGLLTMLSTTMSLGADDGPDTPDPSTVLAPAQWQRVDRSVDRALAWLGTQQQADGSFATHETGQPAVTALCAMAYLARGHLPGKGPYGQRLNRAIDYVLSTQKEDGLIALRAPVGQFLSNGPSHTALYNHAIGALLLSEVYGMVQGARSQRIAAAIEQAIAVTRKHQVSFKRHASDRGGWRYARQSHSPADSDLSATVWHLAFLRSARSAGFDVPAEWVDEAIAYIRRCFDAHQGTFLYALQGRDRLISRGVAGAGITSLALAGEHHADIAQQAADWVLARPFDRYNAAVGIYDRYHYSAYYCTQGMFQLGGRHWRQFFPPLVKTLLQHQNRDGSWPPEAAHDGRFGNTYTTALVVLTLTTPNQILPVFQR